MGTTAFLFAAVLMSQILFQFKIIQKSIEEKQKMTVPADLVVQFQVKNKDFKIYLKNSNSKLLN